MNNCKTILPPQNPTNYINGLIQLNQYNLPDTYVNELLKPIYNTLNKLADLPGDHYESHAALRALNELVEIVKQSKGTI